MKTIKYLNCLLCCLLVTSCSGNTDTEKDEENREKPSESQLNKDDVSYAIGYNIGGVLSETDSSLNLKEITSGLKDAFSKTDSPRMDQTQVKQLLMAYNLEISQAMSQKKEALLAENRQKGSEYQEQFENQEGVKKLADGLLYRIVKKGSGAIPHEHAQVVVDYTGKKIDGEVFFSTKDQGKPANFSVDNVIQGWKSALMNMEQGSTWEIVVPPELAYGDSGVGEVIGPGETLVFEMELLEVKDKETE